MSKKNQRIPAQKPPGKGQIPPVEAPEGRITFSFRYLDLQYDTFSLTQAEDGYKEALLERLKEVYRLTVAEFRKPGKALRSHVICFEETAEPKGFANINRELWDGRAWQFSISSNKHGRIHGFLLGYQFCVVWLDPKHLLYPHR